MSQLSQIFTNIANAIRSKTGSNELITPPQMATAIDNIPSGGGTSLYCWRGKDNPSDSIYLSSPILPASKEEFIFYFENNSFIESSIMYLNDGLSQVRFTLSEEGDSYTRVSDSEFIITSYYISLTDKTFERYSEGDITIHIW